MKMSEEEDPYKRDEWIAQGSDGSDWVDSFSNNEWKEVIKEDDKKVFTKSEQHKIPKTDKILENIERLMKEVSPVADLMFSALIKTHLDMIERLATQLQIGLTSLFKLLVLKKHNLDLNYKMESKDLNVSLS